MEMFLQMFGLINSGDGTFRGRFWAPRWEVSVNSSNASYASIYALGNFSRKFFDKSEAEEFAKSCEGPGIEVYRIDNAPPSRPKGWWTWLETGWQWN